MKVSITCGETNNTSKIKILPPNPVQINNLIFLVKFIADVTEGMEKDLISIGSQPS